MDIVIVEWNDASVEISAEVSIETAQEQHLVPCRTVGFVIKETKEFITVGLTLFDISAEHQDVRGVWTIPKGMIKKIKKLGKA